MRRIFTNRHGLRSRLAARLLLCFVALSGGAARPSVAGPDHPGAGATLPSVRFSGRSLEEALLALRALGLRIVFASNVVTAAMNVNTEPVASAPRALLDELLAPHRLLAREGPSGTLVIVSRYSAPAGTQSAEEPESSTPELTYSEALVIRPSRVSLLSESSIGVLALDRDQIAALPHLGDDLFRSLSLLPGVAANDVSAAFSVRGGRRDETRIVLDGQELFDAYHLHDYDDAQSVIAEQAVAGAELSTGGFDVAHGDRMSGVLDLRTASAAGTNRLRFGAGILGLSAGGDGELPRERGSWFLELRRATFDVVGRLLNAEDPASWDGFGKLALRLGSASTARVSLLRAHDGLDYSELVDGETKRYSTDYSGTHAWLAHEALLGRDLFVESAASLAAIDRDRRGAENEEEGEFAVRDRRETEILELRQGWGFALSPAHELEAGWLWRRYETDYDYAVMLDSDDPLAQLREDDGKRTDRLLARLGETHLAGYVSDRVRIAAPLTLDLGLRYDRYRESSSALVSPRANLAWQIGKKSIVRAAWGRFDQSQRTYELQIEDGESRRAALERSEHRIVGFETLFGGRAGAKPMTFGVELYQRTVGEPRPRYENLVEPINTFPEVEPVRVLVTPEEARARGIELALRGARGARVDWWLAYALSRSEDLVDGRWAPRLFDQTHALALDLALAVGANWRLNLAWRAHTGWPTTPIGLVRRRGELVARLGALNSERLAPYHRLDLRLSRGWRGPRTKVDLYLDVQNLYGRANVAGYDLAIDEERGTIIAKEESWPGFLASAGLRIELSGRRRSP